MEVVVEPGKYIVAVSGGVDSVVLLDVLCRQPQLELVELLDPVPQPSWRRVETEALPIGDDWLRHGDDQS